MEQEKEIEKNDVYQLKEEDKQIWKDMELNEILCDKNLFKRITETEFNKKIEGELNSRKSIFLSLCNIWVDGDEIPINTIVSSESSSGKSFISKQIIKIFPKELIEYRTKITPEAFTYWHNGEEEWNWDGKICYLEDVSQGILDAPTFKVMCSEGSKATIVSKQKAYDIEIKGKPVMIVTTASGNPNNEILGRFQIVSLDETSKQTRDITRRQAEFAETGNSEQYTGGVIRALGLLERKKVKIPYATKIHKYLEQENVRNCFNYLRLRRDFSRLLGLIRCSTVLHQRQRDEKDGFLLATEQDYKIARECINYIQTQTFRGLTCRLKKAFDCCNELKDFTAKDIHSKYPFVNQSMWYIYLDELLQRNMLVTEFRNVEDVKQRVTYYMVNEGSKFELPNFSELPDEIESIKIEEGASDLKENDIIVGNVINDKDNNSLSNNSNVSNYSDNSNKYINKVQIKFTAPYQSFVNIDGNPTPNFESGNLAVFDKNISDILISTGSAIEINEKFQKVPQKS